MVLFVVSDYCSTLEGDDSYSCWRGYFELKELEVSYIYIYKFIVIIIIYKSIYASFKASGHEHKLFSPSGMNEFVLLARVKEQRIY